MTAAETEKGKKESERKKERERKEKKEERKKEKERKGKKDSVAGTKNREDRKDNGEKRLHFLYQIEVTWKKEGYIISALHFLSLCLSSFSFFSFFS